MVARISVDGRLFSLLSCSGFGYYVAARLVSCCSGSFFSIARAVGWDGWACSGSVPGRVASVLCALYECAMCEVGVGELRCCACATSLLLLLLLLHALSCCSVVWLRCWDGSVSPLDLASGSRDHRVLQEAQPKLVPF